MLWRFLLILIASALIAITNAVSQQVLIMDGNGSFQIGNNSYSGFTLKTETGMLSAFHVKTKAGVFTEISIPDYGFSMIEGTPKLPVLNRLIEVPANASVQIKITKEEFEDISLIGKGITNQIIPAQPPLSKEFDNPDDLPFVWDQRMYQKNEFLGGELILAEEAGTMRGTRIFNLRIAPVKYNPVAKIVRVYTEIEAEIIFNDPDIGSTIEEKSRVFSPFFENNLIQLANYKPLETDELITSAPVTMVIVSDPMFQTILQPFINWKKKKGFKVIEGYTNNPSIGTTTTSIKSYLQGLYQAPPAGYNVPSFVLLVGDVAQIPAFNGTAGSHPTDLYYMEYTGDKLPEVYYGRFSATNVGELQPQIDKTLEYEQYLMPDPSFLNKAVIVAGADASHQSTWGNGQVNYGTSNYFNAAHGINASAYLQPLPSGSAALIKAEVSSGAGFVNYSAHCSSSGWADPSFLNSDVPNLQNNHKYNLMVSNCCLSAKFNDASCFGETMMRAANKGSLGYIGGSNNTYWDEDYWWAVGFKTVSANPTYNAASLGAFDRTFHDHGEALSKWYITQGQMTVGGNLAVQQSGSSMKTYYWEIYHLFGDPSLMVYYSQPPVTNATYQGLIPVGATTFEVNTSPYAYVGISKDNVVYGAAIANASGLATVNLNPITIPGVANVVVTRQNGQPFIGTIQVASPAGAFLTLDSFTLDDSSGNNNGQAEPGETISLNVLLENLGTATAYNVQGVLSSGDGYVNITDPSENWPEILPGTTSLQNGAFSFSVNELVPDQHIATFNLTITSGIETWDAVINITLLAPEITIGSMTLSDGNDGIIFPGETATLKFTVQNSGSGTINGASGILTSSHPLFFINSSNMNIGNINPGQSVQISFPVSAAPEIMINSIVNLTLSINALNATGSNTYQTIIGVNTLETFETGNFSKFAWQNGGNAPWTVANTGAYQGAYCAKSGLITHNQTSDLILSADVLNTDSIVFYFKVSSESTYDFLRFYIDNIEKSQWSGTVGYSRAAFQVTQGLHTFKWAYTKDGSVNTGSDCAWVDNIKFPIMMPNTAPVAAFMSDINIANTNQPVQFYDISTGNVMQRTWTFQGGTPATSTEMNPVVTYASPGKYSVSLTVSNSSGSSTKTVADYVLINSQVLQQVIEIPAGWSGISSCLYPEPNDMVTIMAPVSENLVLIQNMDEIYWPGVLNTLDIWNCYEGYKIKVNQSTSLTINGTEIYNRILFLNQGWNLIPVLSVCNADITALFNPVRENLLIVADVAGAGIYWPEFGINTLGELEPGKSYFVYMLEEGVIEFPPACPNNMQPVKMAAQSIESPWITPPFTPGSHVIAFAESALSNLEVNDIIGVFDKSGNCLGQQVFNGNSFAVTAIADDPISSDDHGFKENDQFFFNIYRPSTGEQFNADVRFDQIYGDNHFHPQGISVVKSLEVLTPGINKPDQENLSIYPNPASTSLNIEGSEPISQISIFTPAGNQIINLLSDLGIRSIDIAGLLPGIYILRIHTGSQTLFSKFVKQ